MDNIDWSDFSVALVGNGPLSKLERKKINNDFDVVVRFNNLRNFQRGDKTTILCTKAELFNNSIARNISKDTIVWFLKFKGLSDSVRQLIKIGKCEVVKKANGSNFTSHNEIYPGPKYSEDKKRGYLSSYGFRMFLYILEKNPRTLSYFGFNWSCRECGANSKNDRHCCTAHHWKFERKYIKSRTDGVKVKNGLTHDDNITETGRIMTKIGFDFGKTIGEIEEDQPYPQCFETLTMFIRKLGADRVYIISKAKTEMKEKITEWLTTQNFFTTTGFNRDNMYFVEEYSEKRVLVDKLQINIFVDDSVKVVRYLVDSPHINKMVWFRGESRLLKEISGKYREKVIISNHWNKLHKLVEFF